MKFSQVLVEMEKGREARRSSWLNKDYWIHSTFGAISTEDVLADDWELKPNCIEVPLARGKSIYRKDLNCWHLFGQEDEDFRTLLNEEVQAMYAASKGEPEYVEPEYTPPVYRDWYAVGIADNEECRLRYFKAGHRAGWNARGRAV